MPTLPPAGYGTPSPCLLEECHASSPSLDPCGDPPCGSARVLDPTALVFVLLLNGLLHCGCSGGQSLPECRVDVTDVYVDVRCNGGPLRRCRIRQHDDSVLNPNLGVHEPAGAVGEPPQLDRSKDLLQKINGRIRVVDDEIRGDRAVVRGLVVWHADAPRIVRRPLVPATPRAAHGPDRWPSPGAREGRRPERRPRAAEGAHRQTSPGRSRSRPPDSCSPPGSLPARRQAPARSQSPPRSSPGRGSAGVRPGRWHPARPVRRFPGCAAEPKRTRRRTDRSPPARAPGRRTYWRARAGIWWEPWPPQPRTRAWTGRRRARLYPSR